MADLPPGCSLSPDGDVIDDYECEVDSALAGDKSARWSVQQCIAAAGGNPAMLSPAQLRFLAELVRRVMSGEESAKVAILDKEPPHKGTWWKYYEIALAVRRLMRGGASRKAAIIAVAERYPYLSEGTVERIAKDGYWHEVAEATLGDEEDIAAGRHPSQLWDGGK